MGSRPHKVAASLVQKINFTYEFIIPNTKTCVWCCINARRLVCPVFYANIVNSDVQKGREMGQ